MGAPNDTAARNQLLHWLFWSGRIAKGYKKVRLMRGLTQQELAMQKNTSTKFISNVENGKDTAHIASYKVNLL